MKTLCILGCRDDVRWIQKRLQNRTEADPVSVIAYSFEGRLAAGESGLPCTAYDHEAWKDDRYELFDIARSKAHHWYSMESLQNIEDLKRATDFGAYPLLRMRQVTIMQAVALALHAFRFSMRILEMERPQKVLLGARRSSWAPEDPPWAVTDTGLLEQEAIRGLCRQMGIPCEDVAIPGRTGAAPGRSPADLGRRVWQYVRRLASRPAHRPVVPERDFSWGADTKGPRILFFVWGGYYLQDLQACFDELQARNARIGLVVVGGAGEIGARELAGYRERGICVADKQSWQVEREAEILHEWKQRGEACFAAIRNREDVREYFGEGGYSYLPGMLEEAIRRELVQNIPAMVIELIRSEEIIRRVQPDVVFSHFSGSAPVTYGTCDVLPARRAGIPTLCMDHGVSGYLLAENYNPSTQYYATYGRACRQGLIRGVGFPEGSIRDVGTSRYEAFRVDEDIATAKRELGFDPARPLCIVCSTCEMGGSFEFHHSTFATVEGVLALHRAIPGLQIVYRVHHGVDYPVHREYFRRLPEDIRFEVSLSAPHPHFHDLVRAADCVVAHAGSAITEALLSGVRVLYLCALSHREPVYSGCEVITILDDFQRLPERVRGILENPMSRRDVREKSRVILDRVIGGNDGGSGARLADFLLDLSALRPETDAGWEDWVRRFEHASRFRSETWECEAAGFDRHPRTEVRPHA